MPFLSSWIDWDVYDGGCCIGCGWLRSRWPALLRDAEDMDVCSTQHMVTSILEHET